MHRASATWRLQGSSLIRPLTGDPMGLDPEGIVSDKASGKLYISDEYGPFIIKVDDGTSVSVSKTALFLRWLVLNPATGATKTYAFPLSKTDWSKSDTGQAKMGDIAYVAPGKFLAIEQGVNAAGVLVNKIMLVEIPADATDINALGAELEASSATAKSVKGVAVSGDVTACLTENGKLVNNGTKVCPAAAVRVAPGSASERPTRLYTFKFPKAIASYSVK